MTRLLADGRRVTARRIVSTNSFAGSTDERWLRFAVAPDPVGFE
jgi:hypothetical protein